MIYLKDKKDKKTYGLAAVIVLSLLLVFVSCKSKKSIALTPGERGSAKEIYNKAKTRIKKNPEKARMLFKEIMHLYPDSIYDQESKSWNRRLFF